MSDSVGTLYNVDPGVKQPFRIAVWLWESWDPLKRTAVGSPDNVLIDLNSWTLLYTFQESDFHVTLTLATVWLWADHNCAISVFNVLLVSFRSYVIKTQTINLRKEKQWQHHASGTIGIASSHKYAHIIEWEQRRQTNRNLQVTVLHTIHSLYLCYTMLIVIFLILITEHDPDDVLLALRLSCLYLTLCSLELKHGLPISARSNKQTEGLYYIVPKIGGWTVSFVSSTRCMGYCSPPLVAGLIRGCPWTQFSLGFLPCG